LKKSEGYREDMGAGVWGHSRWGHFYWEGKSAAHALKEIRDLLFPQYNEFDEDGKRKALRDTMHLATHKIHDRDVFVTEDKDFLTNKDVLKERFGVRVLSPSELVEEIEAKHAP
jgi:predicted nucleic acid-binding protein